MKLIVIILIACNICFSQQDLNAKIESLKDSVLLYKDTKPDKALGFGFQVLKIADLSNPTPTVHAVYYRIGEILSYRGLDADAIGFFDQSLKLFEAIPVKIRTEKNINLPPWVLVNIGNIYFKNKDYGKAKLKYAEALDNFNLYENTITKNFGLSTVYDNFGLIEKLKGNYKLAEEYYLNSYQLRKDNNKIEDLIYSELLLLSLNMEQNNMFNVNKHFIEIERLYDQEKTSYSGKDFSITYTTRNYGYAYVNMGNYYLKKEEYKVAKEFFEKSLDLLASFVNDLPIIQSKIAECYLGLKNYEKAMSLAKQNIKSINLNLNKKEKESNLKVLEKIYSKKGDYTNLIKIKDSLLYLSKADFGLDVLNKMGDLETGIFLFKKKSELNESQIKYNTYLFILIICFIILTFSLVSLRLNYNLEKEKSEKILNQKIIVENDLNHKKLELLNKSNFISQRNKNLNYLLASIDYPDSSDSNSSTQIKRRIKDLLRNENLNDRFEKHFEDVYPGFFKLLIKHSSKLTQNDLRFCAYLKMNQSTDEIARITSISIRTVESKKYRLKKKFKIQNNESLTSFIHSI